MKIKDRKKLCKFAKSVKPGYITLFSKKSEFHLQYNWSTCFIKAKKKKICVLKGNENLGMFSSLLMTIFCYNNYNININY